MRKSKPYSVLKNKLKSENVLLFYNQTRFFDKINWVKGDITDIPSLEIAFENVTMFIIVLL